MNDQFLHFAVEGLLTVLLSLLGLMLKTAWSEIQSLRSKVESLKDSLAAFELRVEREFVKHTGLKWIEDKLDKLEKVLEEIRYRMPHVPVGE